DSATQTPNIAPSATPAATNARVAFDMAETMDCKISGKSPRALDNGMLSSRSSQPTSFRQFMSIPYALEPAVINRCYINDAAIGRVNKVHAAIGMIIPVSTRSLVMTIIGRTRRCREPVVTAAARRGSIYAEGPTDWPGLAVLSLE